MKRKKSRKRKRKLENIYLENKNQNILFKPINTLFRILGIGLEGTSFLLAWLFVIGSGILFIYYLVTVFEFSIGGIFGTLVMGFFLLACIGFFIENIEGLSGMFAFFIIIIIGFIFYSFYENYAYKQCIHEFRERPYTFDSIKFVNCDMITEKNARNLSEDYLRQMMINKYFPKQPWE